MSGEFYDGLETRSADERESTLMAALSKQIEHAKANTAYYGALLGDVDAGSVVSRETLASLPVTRKGDLLELQKKTPPFGGMNAVAPSALGRVYMSPGPIYDAEALEADPWRFARSLFAAGFRKGDIVHNCFSYHLTPAGMMVDSAARAIGCAVFPGGVGNTEMQVQAAAELKTTGYGGTPSFLKIILEKARETGADVSSLKKGLVGGEALPPSLRKEISELGCDVLQCYGTADLGLVAYESPALEGMILDEGVIVEIVRPGTGDPVAEGEVGEIVVTTLNPNYPLIRFGTGDMSAVLAGASPCGRTNQRIKGWMGRADQTTKIKGMFVHPGQVAEVAKRHPEVTKARLVVTGRTGDDVMTLHCETRESGNALAEAVAASLQAVTKLRGSVELVAEGSLANDGKVIEDARSYD
ncbi:AMP-binding protein [Nisaea acidiphila]|uniref:AMP-binding protein n=1 Tax=Nisaea acidiphila TaxID=1862145 RepID=A0A9J7ATL4_9PROT|nr:AMP-binding protein [Nisaea acidiphila]UUX49668.1 AMP-binding protein [Nisaea acidiphila]